MNTEIKDLLLRLADDDLILGHRHSEWTGLGPILEEDIAFSSMGQDEIGHALAYYKLMEEHLDGGNPDQVAFNRKPEEFRSCHFVEAPNGDYAFSLMRHILYDLAESIRLESLTRSSFAPLAELAKKLLREEKYHSMHAEVWISQLSTGTEESKIRMQNALNEAWPMAFGLFELTSANEVLVNNGISLNEKTLEKTWVEKATAMLTKAGLTVPENVDTTKYYGGRKGQHTQDLADLLKEMTEVFVIDPSAIW